jgi:hypothetical protein
MESPPPVATIASWRVPLGAWGGSLVAPLLYPLHAWWTAYPIYSLTLVLKAPDVFFMTRGIGHHDVPFHPDLEGKRLEFDRGGWIHHAANMPSDLPLFQLEALPLVHYTTEGCSIR